MKGKNLAMGKNAFVKHYTSCFTYMFEPHLSIWTSKHQTKSHAGLLRQTWSPSSSLSESLLLCEMQSITWGPLPGGSHRLSQPICLLTLPVPHHYCKVHLACFNAAELTYHPVLPFFFHQEAKHPHFLFIYFFCLLLFPASLLLLSLHFSGSSCFGELTIQYMTWSDLKATGYSYYCNTRDQEWGDGDRRGRRLRNRMSQAIPSMA